MPPPTGDPEAKLQALIFDAEYNDYRGVIIYLRIMQGTIRKGDKVYMHGTQTSYEVLEIGRLAPAFRPEPEMHAGEVGYLVCNIKRLQDVKVGDTITHHEEKVRGEPLAGFREPKPMVFCGFYPTSPGDFDELRKSLEKLQINDSSFTFEAETSDALGFGFRCGCLGLLHMEIIQQRLEREEDMDMVQTAPTVTYRIVKGNGEEVEIHSPSDMPDPSEIEEYLEPVVALNIVVPTESIGAVMKLCTERRGIYTQTEYYGAQRVMLSFEMPFSEIIFDFHDRLKSVTRGFGTMDYEITGYQAADLVRVRVLVSNEEVDALSFICHRDVAQTRGRKILQKLRSEIPRHMFEVALQAAVGGKIIARENIRALSKNVTAKCYGGDITRKRKLLEKQKEGKRRMKQVGRVEIPQKAFLSVLASEDD